MRIDDDIVCLARRLRDLEGLPESEVERIIREYFNRAGRDELDEYLENLTECTDEVRQELEEARDDLRDLERGEERDAAEEDLDTVRGYLREFEQLIDEVYQGITDHFRDFTNGADVNIGSDSLEINAENNGSTYIYTLSGANNSPFGAGSAANPLEGVTRDGTATSEVIKDVNGDQRLSYADIEKAIADANMARLNQQNVFINTDPSWHWELVPGAPGNATTFRVTSGEFSTLVTFENSAGATFYFQSGITEEDVNSGVLEQWGDDLLSRSFWGDSTRSFYDELHASEVNRLAAIPGYDDLVNNAEEALNYTDGSMNDEEKGGYRAAIDAIFNFIDTGGTDVTSLWTEILDKWNELGLNQANRSRVIQYLITMTFLNAKNIFTEFIAKASAQLQGLMTYEYTAEDDPTKGEKVAILILETQGAPSGQYDPTTIMQTLFGHASEDGSGQVDGEWTNNTDNVEVLRDISTLISNGGGMPVQGLADVRSFEETASQNGGNGTFQLSEDKYNEIIAQVSQESYAEEMRETDGSSDSSLSNGTSNAELRDKITNICRQISDTAMSIEEMREVILSYINELDDRDDNDVANVLIQLLHDHSPDLLNALTEGPEGQAWANSMWAEISSPDSNRDTGWMSWDSFNDKAEHTDITFGYLYG